MRRVTIKDVAKAAGVSSATVSYVMNDLGKVTPEVDAHVRRVAAELGYSRSRAALALKTGRHGAIGCLLPTLESPIFPQIAAAVQIRAEELGLSTLLVDTGASSRSEAQALKLLADQGVDGVVAVLNVEPEEKPDYALVTMDCGYANYDSIRCDHVDGARQAAHEAARLGYRRAGLMIGDLKAASSSERAEGFIQGAREAGLEIIWRHEVPLGHDLPDYARAAIAERKVEVIVCVNDMVAMGCLSAAHEMGLKVPEELAVIGFDDVPMSSWPLIGLSTFRWDSIGMGRRAVDLLLRRIEDPSASFEEVILPVVPALRMTTRRL